MRSILSILLAAFLFLPAGAAARPRLLVVVSVDQLSAELLARWSEDGAAGGLPAGLGSLLRNGTRFTSAYHEHGFTETGPGHSVLLSGRHPRGTGIVENDWFDRAAGRWVYCMDDPSARTHGLAKPVGSGPRTLLTTTLAGWLKAQVPGARAFAVSGKDRSAIPMAGAVADGVYWFDSVAGGFTTSTAFASALPDWLRARNQAWADRLSDRSLVWTPLDPAEAACPQTFELPGRSVTLGLPRLIKGVGMPLAGDFWPRFRASPFFDEAIFETAEALMDAEALGRKGGTDLLAVGLSATDYIGHRFGSGGPEMRDQLRRLDRRLGVFLKKVAARDPGAWVVLAADHGCADFCERLRAQGFPARRGDFKAWMALVERQLAERLGLPGPFLHSKLGSNQLYLREEAFKGGPRSRSEVLAAALAVLRAQPELSGAWSLEELEALVPDPAAGPEQRSVPERIRLSLAPGRAGDLLIAPAPYFTFDSPPDVVGHGAPWDYDRRVPLVFHGPWRAEVRREPVRTVDLAATLAAELGLLPPQPLDGRPLALRRKGPGKPR